jgi:hypothetical protein
VRVLITSPSLRDVTGGYGREGRLSAHSQQEQISTEGLLAIACAKRRVSTNLSLWDTSLILIGANTYSGSPHV